MYRSPEMLDLYQNNPINEQSDIWVSDGGSFRFRYIFILRKKYLKASMKNIAI